MPTELNTGALVEEVNSGNYPKEYKRFLLAEKIKQKLKDDKMKIGVFAEKLGKKPPEVSKWLSGNHNFTLDTLSEIEEVLGINLINIDPPYKEVTNGSVDLDIKCCEPINDLIKYTQLLEESKS